MLFRARTTVFVDDRLYMEDETFTPNPARNHKPGAGWEPIDAEAKAAYAAAGSPKPYIGTVDMPSVPVDWRAEALKAGWQPAATDAPVAPFVAYGAAPPVSTAAASAAAPVKSKPAEKKPVDDGEI